MSKKSTDLATTENQDNDAKIEKAKQSLESLAEDLDESLATKVYQLANLTSPEIKGMEGATGATVPQIVINQPMSNSPSKPSASKPGDLYTSEGTIIGESIDVIPVVSHPVRKKWGEDGLDCMSLDGEYGSKYGKCEDCPYSRFEKGSPPDCSPGYHFYTVTESLDKLYRIEFIKSSAKAGKNIRQKTTPPALWARSFTVGTEHHTGNNRNYYTFKTAPTGRETDEMLMKVCDALHEFFQVQYQSALEKQKQFSARLNNDGNNTITVDASSGDKTDFNDDDDEGQSVTDFSDNL